MIVNFIVNEWEDLLYKMNIFYELLIYFNSQFNAAIRFQH